MSRMTDDIGDRMKAYEAVETDRTFDRSLPLVVRLDGRAFSTFTRGMEKPFDESMTNTMDATCAYLIERTHAVVGYTQSDEITLIYEATGEASELLFGGRAFKIASVLAGMASARFALLAQMKWPERVARSIPAFDCRAFSVPSRVEATNMLIWRELDASRNAILAVGQSRFSPKQMHGQSCRDVLSMLEGIGVTMDQFSLRARHGAYMGRRNFQMTLTPEELERIPEKHRPTGPVTRSRVVNLDCAPLIKYEERTRMIFDDAILSETNGEKK